MTLRKRVDELEKADPLFPSEYAVQCHGVITDLLALLDRAMQGLEDAKENIIEWGSYAGSYHQEKWDLQGDIQSIEQTLADIRKQLDGDNNGG